jgi:hypothetical protein
MRIALIWHRLCLNWRTCVRRDGTVAVTGGSSSDIRGNSRSVSTQRRGDTQCLLLRLRRYRRQPAAARFLQSSKNNAVSSSRFWIVSSRRASSGRRARKRASSPAAKRNRRNSSFTTLIEHPTDHLGMTRQQAFTPPCASAGCSSLRPLDAAAIPARACDRRR